MDQRHIFKTYYCDNLIYSNNKSGISHNKRSGLLMRNNFSRNTNYNNKSFVDLTRLESQKTEPNEAASKINVSAINLQQVSEIFSDKKPNCQSRLDVSVVERPSLVPDWRKTENCPQDQAGLDIFNDGIKSNRDERNKL
jgi:hypothetical protein